MFDYEYIRLVTWYLQKKMSERLDTTEEDNNAFKLYP